MKQTCHDEISAIAEERTLPGHLPKATMLQDTEFSDTSPTSTADYSLLLTKS